MWLALATITIAAAIGFSVLALAIQKTDNRKDEQEQGGSFGPDEIRVMTAAFDQILDDLRLWKRDDGSSVDRGDPVVTLVAKRIIELAKKGERDPTRLRDSALSSWLP
jgi:hypothetical protein